MQLPNIPPIEPGTIVLITGPSGAGKSSLIPLLIDHHRPPSDLANTLPPPDEPLIDALPLRPPDAARALASCGLTDALTWARTIAELSDGQRHRWLLCWSLFGDSGIVVADDWTAPLDRLTARAYAWTAGRELRHHGRTAIFATTHDDVATCLQPDVHLRVGWSPEPQIIHPMATLPHHPELDQITVRRGTLADYRPMAHLHYAAGPPRSPRTVWVAEHPALPQPAAVAVLTYPDLANPARDLATDGRYRRTQDRQVCKRLNEEVARLARIVVTPEIRGIGVTRLLIDAIVRHDNLSYLECSTSMAHFTPFLDHLGFIEAPRPPHDVEARLLDWADRHAIDPKVSFDSDDLAIELERLSVREAREGRRLIWAMYHKHVLYRRTKQAMPKNVPNANDDRWLQAFAYVARRLFERPRYLILPINPPTEEPS